MAEEEEQKARDVGLEASRALEGEDKTCPHCGARAHREASARFRWVCGACGGPRLATKDISALSDERVLRELRKADAARKHAFARRVLATGLAATGTLVAVLGAVLAGASMFVSMALLAIAIGFFLPAVIMGRAARRFSKEAQRSTFAAWEAAAELVLRSAGRDLSGPELAQLLGTDEADVERMMSFLSADNRARIDVAGAELVYAHAEAAYAGKHELEPAAEPEDEEDEASADERRR